MVERADNRRRVVAQGKKPQKGKDGFVEILFDPTIKAVTYDEENLRVDFKEKIEIPSVEEGDVLAIIHLPTSCSPRTLCKHQSLFP